jgi:hypothetical protein
MTKQEALDFISTAKDIHDWNQKRQIIKYAVDPTMRKEILRDIDCFGLSSHILAGKNHRMLNPRLNAIRNESKKDYQP